MERKNVLGSGRPIAAAALPWRTMLVLMFVLMFSSRMMAENATPVTQIEVGKWYRLSDGRYDWATSSLFCNGIEQCLKTVDYVGQPKSSCEAWTFEPTDDGFYYVRNSLGAYIADYAKHQYDILSGTKSQAVKLKVICEDDRILLQNMSDSSYLSISYPSVCWSQTKESVLVTEVPSTSFGCSERYTECQLQVGENILLDNLDRVQRGQWTSNDESIATVTPYGEVTGLKEGDVIVWYNDSVNGYSGFTKVTVKNNPCEHEYDPEHDIMAKYVGSGSGWLMSKGYVQFYNEYYGYDYYKYDESWSWFDIYIDGVKLEHEALAPSNGTINGVYVGYMPPTFDLDYVGVHTMIIAPKNDDGNYRVSFNNLPEKMFYNVFDVDGLGNVYSGPDLVELHLPTTLFQIGNYNGYGCAYLKDIYVYGATPYYDTTNPKVFCDIFGCGDDYYNSICGRLVLGTKQLHIKSNSGVLDQLTNECDFRVKCIDKPEQKIWINASDSYKILVGKSIYISYFPGYLTIKYSVSDPEVLEKTYNGYVAKKLGKATITIWNSDSTQVIKTISVEVVEEDFNLVKVQTVTITPSELTLYANETATLSVAYAPEDASDKRVIWKSSDNSVAMVSGGVVAGLKEGTCTITATATDGGGAYGECKVTVLVPDGIDNVNNDATTTESWYTLQGIKLSGRPAESGVYICNGKKVVVK